MHKSFDLLYLTLLTYILFVDEYFLDIIEDENAHGNQWVTR